MQIKVTLLIIWAVYLVAKPLACAPAQAAVAIAFNQKGLSSLMYQGAQLLAYGDLRFRQITMCTKAGSTFLADLTATNVSMNVTDRYLTQNYKWGSTIVFYKLSGNRLTLTITVINRSKSSIRGFWMEPLAFRFPSKLREYDGVNPLLSHNTGAPTAIALTYSSAVMVAVNEDVHRPLLAGFPWAADRPASTIFPFTVATDRVKMFPDSLPVIHRSIPPGRFARYQVSFRFGPPGSTVETLAPDIFRKFVTIFPPQLNWPDRRSIGMLVLGTSAAGWAKNPRGWLLDPAIDITTPAGIASLRNRILGYADNSISILSSMNAQGMITWDIEGEQFPHATTYVGDPRLFSTLAPEMAGIADEYFKKFRDAGFRVGVCIRPQRFVLGPQGRTASQLPAADAAQLMIDKMKYARKRWGATLFYVDSNVNPSDPNPMDAKLFQRVAAAFSDSLLIPEHATLQYFAYTAPYRELRQGFDSAPPLARAIYPNAFSLINIADSLIAPHYDALIKAVAHGDVLLAHGWFDDKRINSEIPHIYQAASAGQP